MKQLTIALATLCAALFPSFALGQQEKEEVGPHYQHLKDFEYFVGDWKVDGKMKTDFEPLVELTKGRLTLMFSYGWMKDKSFFTLDIRKQRKSPVEYHAVFGWDSVKKQIRSRDFNSQGAWFDVEHVKKKNVWVIEGTSVYPGGVEGTTRGEITIVDDDTFRYEGTGVMKVDGKDVAVDLTYEATRRKPRKKK